MEEVVANLEMVTNLQEERLLYYLSAYNNQFLYQKTGFLLEDKKAQLGLSNAFFDECKNKIGKSKRYLSKDYKQGNFQKEWNLIIPYELDVMKNGEIKGYDGV